jgi:L-lactate permease
VLCIHLQVSSQNVQVGSHYSGPWVRTGKAFACRVKPYIIYCIIYCTIYCIIYALFIACRVKL